MKDEGDNSTLKDFNSILRKNQNQLNHTQPFLPDSTEKDLLSPDSTETELIIPDSTNKNISPPDSTEDLSNKKDSTANNLISPDSTEKNIIPEDSTYIQNGIDSLMSADSLANGDSLTILDSLNAVDTQQVLTPYDSLWLKPFAKDSAARLKYFHYQRRELPVTLLKRKKESAFFVQPSANFKTREVEIDSTGNYVKIVEKIAGQQTKILLRMPLSDYIDLKLALKEREIWEEIGYAYEVKNLKTGLGDLITDITDFEIPLPSVGVLSIFGEPKISLKIGGAVDIHGAWRNETTEGVTASRLGNTRNEPDFKQQVQINVQGTIGDKLNINADWNTERTFEYENQLKIKYTGYEDEIIQSIEAGNVSLQTSPLVGGSEALFGLKAKFKMGPFSLTTLASQKKGEIKEVSVSGGSTSQEYEIHAYEYSTNNYFLDTAYRPIFNLYYGQAVPEYDPALQVIDIEVWKSIQTIGRDPSKERQAVAYINLPPILEGESYPDSLRTNENPIPGEIEFGRFRLLEPEVDYKLHAETGYITFNTNIQQNDVLAVAYRISGVNNNEFFGEFLNTTEDSVLVLKLIKPSSLTSEYDQAWSLLLKNIYPLGGRNIKKEGFEFNIEYDIPGQEPVEDFPTDAGSVRLLEAFGLDKYDASGNQNPDGEFDFEPGITILTQTGEVIFPVLEPFGNQLPESLPDSVAYNSVYDTTKTFAQQDKVKDKWLLTGKYSGEASSVYQLGFNIVENSVRVLLNGRELSAGSDYVVDYNTGQLTIRNDAALVVGADLKITYEQNDLFQLASKTLLGARGIYEFSDKTSLGFSILNLNQQTLSDKVRIGEEPLSNTIMGVDFKTSADLPFLTKALDYVISTREMSTFSLSGEYAYIDPDPNTKKSNIASDNGQSIAYIDDFEGAKRIIPVGVNYTSWKDLSAPESLPFLSDTLTAPEKMDYKAKSFWFTITPSSVTVNDIWGDRKQVAQGDQQVTVMDYVFIPDTAGTYNYNPNFEDPKKSWGGIMKGLSSTASNLVEENIEFLEFWVNIPTAPEGSNIYIDLGRISEDVIPNRVLDTEDKDFNDAIDPEGNEDTGIDGIFDGEERTKFNSNASDPSGDNFNFSNVSGSSNLYDYFSINGTQGNAVLTDIGRLPDTEDLNRNGNIDLVNSYFRYKVPLDTNRNINPFIQGGGDTDAKWYLMRVPLKDTSEVVGNPSFTNIEYIRMFVNGVESNIHLRFAEFNLVGSQWQKVLPEDSILAVSVINFEDNPNYYLPPGVSREKDRTRPDEDILFNEQSLNLIVNDLEPGQQRSAVKYLFRPLDVFNYKEMKLFVHGDDNPGRNNLATNDAKYRSEVFFRFGADTNNYYEYRQPVRPGWNEIAILFNELTALKQRQDTIQSIIISEPVAGKPGHFYRLKGNPSLTQVKYLQIGIENITNKGKRAPEFGETLSGTVWINELRVIGAEDTPGWAYSVSTSLKLADLLSVNFNMSETNPYFHKLAERFGSRVSSRNWGTSAELDILKLLPVSLPNSNLKLNYSHTESIGKPLYLPQTDIPVDEAAEESENPDELRNRVQSVNISDTWTASNIKIRIPTSYWLIRDTFNSLTFGFNYNKSFSRGPTTLSNKRWEWKATMNYSLNLSQDNYFKPVEIPVIGTVVALLSDYKDVKIYYSPQNFNMNLSVNRKRNTNITRPQNNVPGQTQITRDFLTNRGFGFGWKITEGGFLNLSTNYNVDIKSSLAFLETIERNNRDIQRPESEIWKDILSGVFFGRDFQYNQNWDIKTNPSLPTLWDINRYFQITAGYSVSYQWNNQFKQEELGRSAGFSSRSNVGLTLRWQALTAPLFETEEEKETEKTTPPGGNRNKRGGRNNREREISKEIQELVDEKGEVTDSTRMEELMDSLNVSGTDELSDTLQTVPKESSLKRAFLFLKSAVKFILFDYETFTINFTNDNSLSKSGIYGEGTGFKNFWGFTFDQEDGPSRGFMIGLSDNVGSRAPGGNLSDVFSQKNNFDFKTSRPLWEGAKIDLNWRVGWSINRNTTLVSDEDGNVSVQNITSTGKIEKSFLSFPPTLFLSVFNSGITQVNELYNPNIEDPQARQENLSNAFLEGFESFPIFSGLSFLEEFAKYVPRPNWRFTWDGLEDFFIFKSLAERVSLQHEYKSSYTEGWKLSPDGNKEIQTQRIEYGFSPLAGLNLTFGELWGGNLTGNIKYGTRTSFDLGITTNNITETFSRDIGITAGYSKQGFEIPLFGVSLQNDIEFSFSYTSTQNSTIRYDMDNFTEEGTPQDGTVRVTMEPRIRYTISSKVELSIFYRRTSVEPEGAARIPPTTTNEAGLDVHISIQ